MRLLIYKLLDFRVAKELIKFILCYELEPLIWSSYFTSVSRLIDIFGSVCVFLEKLIDNGLNSNIHGEAKGAYKDIKSFEFVSILHLMNKVLRIFDILCQALQMKSQDILNAIRLVSTTKVLFQKLREDGWNTFIKDVELFCERYDIEMPNMSARYIEGTTRSCQQKNHITVEHYYRINIFNVVIDFYLMELNSRFTKQTKELLTLSLALSLIDGFKSFKIDDICTLAQKFYAQDFTQTELDALRRQLEHYEYAIVHHSELQTMGSLSELLQALVETLNIFLG
ncbi:hypothetical protein PTKIN_Ptkin18bG0073400 [Pterospermum kingtungense]